MSQILQAIGRVEIPLRERRELDGGRGFKWVTVGRRVATVEIRLDVTQVVATFGARAARNLTGRATVARGALVVRAIKREDERFALPSE